MANILSAPTSSTANNTNTSFLNGYSGAKNAMPGQTLFNVAPNQSIQTPKQNIAGWGDVPAANAIASWKQPSLANTIGSWGAPSANNAVSSTTLSNSNKIDQVQKNQQTLGQVSQKGLTTDANGNALNANGTVNQTVTAGGNVPAGWDAQTYANFKAANPDLEPTPEDTAHMQQVGTGRQVQVNGQQPYTTADTTPEDSAIHNILDHLIATSDANTASAIQSIQGQYAIRQQQQTMLNQASQKATQNALLMGGVTGEGSSAQFAPISSQGIIQAQESYGIQQLSALDAQENSDISAARQAGFNQDFQLQSKMIDQINSTRQSKIDLASKINDNIIQQNQKMSEQILQSQVDNSIADVFAGGITDPAAILTTLKSKGVNVTQQQIATTLGLIAQRNGVDPTKLSNDTQEFLYLKSIPNGLPPSITSLGSEQEQLSAYLQLKNRAITSGKAKPVSSGTASDSGTVVPTVSGGNVIAGVSIPEGVSATDLKAVLEGRNTLQNIRQTVGRSKAADAKMQALRDTLSKIDPNFDFVASDAGGKSVSTSYVQRATAAINSVLPNIDKVVDLSNQVNRVGIKGVDALLQKGALQIGDQKVSNFHQAQKLIADEIGVALGAGTVSDMKLQLGFDVTDPSVSPEVFASNMAIVKDFINNRKSGLNELRYKSSVTTGDSHNGIILPGDTSSSATFNGITLPH